MYEDLDDVLGFVIDDIKVFSERRVHLVVDEVVKFFSFFFNFLAPLLIIDIRICEFIRSTLLDDVEAELARMKTYVNQFIAQVFEFV